MKPSTTENVEPDHTDFPQIETATQPNLRQTAFADRCRRARPHAAGYVLCVLFFCMPPGGHAAEWPPISKEELAMADDPSNPGALAILLYREVHTDDVKSLQTEYRRIKVLKEEGRKFGDIEIPYFDRADRIEEIQARTVRPDGTPVNFEGQIIDRTAVRMKKFKVGVKAFTLPEVQKGSILEYSYTIRLRHKAEDYLRHPHNYIVLSPIAVASADWWVQEDLFTRRARFSVRPFPDVPLQWIVKSIPALVHPQNQADGTTVLEVENIPAYQEEEYGPPESVAKGRATFYYLLGLAVSRTYWSDLGKNMAEPLNRFLGDPKKLKNVVAGIISAGDPPEAQLRKLYARVQKIRYLSYEQERTEQEEQRENLKQNKSVEDVLKHDYAAANQINLVLVALARAAGFDAAPVRIMSRDKRFFEPLNPVQTQFDAMVVWVRAGEKDYFLDPATRFCPFDLLPWEETATTGILIWDRPHPFKGNPARTDFDFLVSLPKPTSATALVERKAALKVDATGAVDGSVGARFIGQEALDRRLATRDMDENARKKALEDEIKSWMSSAATVELKGPVNWDRADEPLRADFRVKVPAYAAVTGRRLLFRSMFFEGSAKAFQQAERVHDIYVPYPYEEADEVTWKLPQGYQVESLPEKQHTTTAYGDYTMSLEQLEGAVQIKRRFSVQFVYVPKSHYLAIRALFNLARSGDASQIVLDNLGGRDAKQN